MLRTFEQLPDGLGRLTCILEDDDELQQLQAAAPEKRIPGVITDYEWPPAVNGRGRRFVLFSKVDPHYKPAAAVPPPAGNSIKPMPSRAALADWKLEDLITKAAELSVPYVKGETKAALLAKLVPAWEALNAELSRPKTTATGT